MASLPPTGGNATQNADPELGQSTNASLEENKHDPDLVTWDSPQDPENPKDWTVRQKMIVTVVVSCFTFMSPVSSSMISPALSQVGEDLSMKKQLEVEMALSIFILGYAVGPLFFGPLSEVLGRSRVLQLSNLFFLAWNLGCGFAQTEAELFIFRFLAGIGGSAPLAVGAGVIRYDLFNYVIDFRRSRLIDLSISSSATVGLKRKEEKLWVYTALALYLDLFSGLWPLDL